MPHVSSPIPTLQSHPANTGNRTTQLREAAQELETNFLAEMLKSTGLGKTSGAFGGGTGEDQFASFLNQAHAREMVRAGGIGLAEVFFNTLQEQQNADK